MNLIKKYVFRLCVTVNRCTVKILRCSCLFPTGNYTNKTHTTTLAKFALYSKDKCNIMFWRKNKYAFFIVIILLSIRLLTFAKADTQWKPQIRCKQNKFSILLSNLATCVSTFEIVNRSLSRKTDYRAFIVLLCKYIL